MADAPVLSGLGYHAPAAGKTAITTQSTQSTQTTMSTKPAPSSTPRTTAVDDEDIFLGDDVANVDVDVDVDPIADEEDDEDEDDFDDDYFSSTYRPLSNLPTPPPSSHTSLAHSPATDAAINDSLQEDMGGSSLLLGPAVHLVNMLPPAASLATPSVALVQAMLARAQLPLETVALAVCILDSLDSRFARTWRLTCPLGAPSPSPSSLSAAAAAAASTSTTPSEKRHTLPSPLTPSFPSFVPDGNVDRLLHIDAVFPEVIILAALVIAAKFTDDGFASQQPAQAYCAAWGSSTSPSTGPGPCALWTGAQLAATERCIMQNLGYRILPLLDADLLADAQADMHRAGVQALRSRARAASASAATAMSKKAPKKAIMTPPEEAMVDGAVRASSSFAPALAPPPPGNLTLGLGLLQLAPSTVSASDELDKVGPIHLTLPPKAQRRHHVSSHSECFGRFAAYER